MPAPDHTIDTLIDTVADALYRLPGVEAVALGGSRAQGTNRTDSDWDVAIYYRDGFDPQTVRDLGWPGDLTGLGGWGPLFNGGGKLNVDGELFDIHYRDLGLIEEIRDTAILGDFGIEPLLFHQAGIPSYILLAELGINRALRGPLPQWDYPEALRESAPGVWWDRAVHTLRYAEGHARQGRVAQCAGLLSEAACYAAHAILAHRGEWVTNEKQLLSRAGLRGVDAVLAELGTAPERLLQATRNVRELLLLAVGGAGVPAVTPQASGASS